MIKYGYFARLNAANDALYSARQSFVLAIIELIFLFLNKMFQMYEISIKTHPKFLNSTTAVQFERIILAGPPPSK